MDLRFFVICYRLVDFSSLMIVIICPESICNCLLTSFMPLSRLCNTYIVIAVGAPTLATKSNISITTQGLFLLWRKGKFLLMQLHILLSFLLLDL